MYNRRDLNQSRRSSSKEFSTATTLRNRTPSINGYELSSPRSSIMRQPQQYIDGNLESLNTLKNLLVNEQNIIEMRKRWNRDMINKIQNVFQVVTQDICMLLNLESVKMKQIIEKQYRQFLRFLAQVKNKLRNFYSNKNQELQSEKVLSLQKKWAVSSNEYYVSQNLQVRSQYDDQNEQRSKLKENNYFYQSKQSELILLSQKAAKHLSLYQQLQQKQFQLESILERYKDTIDQSTRNMAQNCFQILQI